MKYSCQVWAFVPNCYLDMLGKLQKQVQKVAGPTFAACNSKNVADSSFICWYYFGRSLSELAELSDFCMFMGGLIVIPISCMVFLSPFLHDIRVSMSKIYFLAQLDLRYIYLLNASLLLMI